MKNKPERSEVVWSSARVSTLVSQPALFACVCWFALCWNCKYPAETPQGPTDGVVIAGVSLVDVQAETVLPGVDIVIIDGTIEAVGPDLAAKYRSLRRIDGRGRFAIPGLCDAHIHIDTAERTKLMLPEATGLGFGIEDPIEDLGVYPRLGITTVVALDGSEEQLEIRDHSNSGDWSLPRLLVSTPILDGPESGNPLHIRVDSREDAVTRINDYSSRSYDLVKVYTFLGADAYDAILTRSAEMGWPVWGHLPKDLTLEEALDPRLDVVAHAEELTRFWDGESPDFAQSVVKMLVERGIALIPNLVAYDQIIAEIEDLDALLATKNWDLVPPLARIYSQVPYNGYVSDFGGEEIRSRALSLFRRHHEMMFEIVRQMEAQGGVLLAGSDAGNPTMYPGDGLHRELELLVAAGLSPYRALASATVTLARQLGEESKWGMIAPGMDANLVLLETNPVTDIRNVRSISSLYFRGQYVDWEMLEESQQRLSQNFALREADYRRFLAE